MPRWLVGKNSTHVWDGFASPTLRGLMAVLGFPSKHFKTFSRYSFVTELEYFMSTRRSGERTALGIAPGWNRFIIPNSCGLNAHRWPTVPEQLFLGSYCCTSRDRNELLKHTASRAFAAPFPHRAFRPLFLRLRLLFIFLSVPRHTAFLMTFLFESVTRSVRRALSLAQHRSARNRIRRACSQSLKLSITAY